MKQNKKKLKLYFNHSSNTLRFILDWNCAASC